MFREPVVPAPVLVLSPRLSLPFLKELVRGFEVARLRREGQEVPQDLVGSLAELPAWVTARAVLHYRYLAALDLHDLWLAGPF